MGKYEVTLERVFMETWKVEAKSESEACRKAADQNGSLLDQKELVDVEIECVDEVTE